MFIDVLTEDNLAAATAASHHVVDNRTRVFHDPKKRAGRSMARTLGWRHHIAWDCYLFYPAGVRWDGPHMPPATRWIHQLRDREVWEAERPGETNAEWTSQIQERTEALSYRFRTGGGLVSALRVLAAEAIARDHGDGIFAPSSSVRLNLTHSRGAEHREPVAVSGSIACRT